MTLGRLHFDNVVFGDAFTYEWILREEGLDIFAFHRHRHDHAARPRHERSGNEKTASRIMTIEKRTMLGSPALHLFEWLQITRNQEKHRSVATPRRALPLAMV